MLVSFTREVSYRRRDGYFLPLEFYTRKGRKEGREGGKERGRELVLHKRERDRFTE